jgi:hypothetical protein
LWKVEDAVESLSREILTIQAKGDKPAAQALLQSRATMTQPLRVALEKIEHMQVLIKFYCVSKQILVLNYLSITSRWMSDWKFFLVC